MRESPHVSQAWANSCQGGETWESWARGCVGPAASIAQHFRSRMLVFSLSLGISQTPSYRSPSLLE